jgi:AraC-like DNA-binding protein
MLNAYTMKTSSLQLMLLFCIVLMCRAPLWATQPQYFKQVVENKSLDIYPYQRLYKQYQKIKTLDSIYHQLVLKVSNVELQALNRIAYATSLDRLGYHQKAIALLEKVNQQLSAYPKIIQAEYYAAMGNLGIGALNPDFALKQYQKSIDVLKGVEDVSEEIIQSKLIALGVAYNALEQAEKAKKIFQEALTYERLGPNRNSLYLELNLALSNSKLGFLEEAKANFKKALNIIKVKKDLYAEIRTYGNLADIYIKQDSLAKAAFYYQKGMKLASANGFNLDLIRFNRAMSKLFQLKNEFKSAYAYLERADSLNNRYNTAMVSEKMAALEQFHKIEQERLEKEIRGEMLKNERRKNYVLILLGILLGLACLFLVWQLRQLKLKNKVLVQQQLPPKKKEIESISEASSEHEKYKDLIRQLEEMMKSEQLYKQTNLSLEELAKLLQSNRTYLSEAINSHYQKNFSRWLNECRVKASKELLANPEFDNYSIEGIAKEVGFSSISTFNSNFKKITGLTPSYFRKNR